MSGEYIQSDLRFSWDLAKAASNLAKHGVDMLSVQWFRWDQALIESDVRGAYLEPRLVAFGPIAVRLHVLVFSVERRSVRVISLRKANSKEVRWYEDKIRNAYA